MALDYRTLEGSDWVMLGVILLLCLFIAWVLAFRPKIPWRSTQRWRAPQQKEEELGEPTPGFCRASKGFAVIVLLLGVLAVLLPFLPLIKGE